MRVIGCGCVTTLSRTPLNCVSETPSRPTKTPAVLATVPEAGCVLRPNVPKACVTCEEICATNWSVCRPETALAAIHSDTAGATLCAASLTHASDTEIPVSKGDAFDHWATAASSSRLSSVVVSAETGRSSDVMVRAKFSAKISIDTPARFNSSPWLSSQSAIDGLITSTIGWLNSLADALGCAPPASEPCSTGLMSAANCSANLAGEAPEFLETISKEGVMSSLRVSPSKCVNASPFRPGVCDDC